MTQARKKSEDIPVCEAFDPTPHPPSFCLPAGACDAHMHIFAAGGGGPLTPNRTYTPAEASLEAYRHLQTTLGLERTVVVQPSVYGIDNRVTLEALQAMGDNARGVVVIDESIEEAELRRMDAMGVCGVRLNLLFRGGIDWETAEALAHRIADYGWHLQLLIDVSEFEALEEKLGNLPVDVVIDHMGHLPAMKGTDSAGFEAMLRLLEKGHCWVKLSGPYRISQESLPPYSDVIPFAQKLVDTRPDRLVWGSDWPHPHIPGPVPNDGDLIDLLPQWTPDTTTQKQILSDNPAVLYRFS